MYERTHTHTPSLSASPYAFASFPSSPSALSISAAAAAQVAALCVTSVAREIREICVLSSDCNDALSLHRDYQFMCRVTGKKVRYFSK